MLTILTAHKAEAQPFIDKYKLTQQMNDKKQTYYANKNLRLLITGQGGRNCEYSLNKFIESASASNWLNFGAAGSSEFPVGTLVQIDLLSNGTVLETQKSSSLNLPVSNIITVNEPERYYEDKGVYDMEAQSIFHLLRTHNQDHTLTIIKLISDGPDHPLVDKKSIKHRLKQLIEDNTSTITAISDIILYN